MFLSKRTIMLSLLTSTALTSAAFAQTAPALDAGTIVISAPEAQPGLTASPTDLAIQKKKRATLAAKRDAADRAAKQAQERRAAANAAKASASKRQAAAAAAEADAADEAAAAAEAEAAAYAAANPDAVPGRPTSPNGVKGNSLGGGYMVNEVAKKSRSTTTRDAIAKQNPTANPYQIISLLPGVTMSSTDNTGLNGGNIRLRGFNSDKVGMTIEGAPVNDSGSYSLFPQEYVDAQNMEQVSIAQGQPDLDSPHVGAIGGVINLYMRDPSTEKGGYVESSIGSHNMNREFLRLETGQIGGFRAYGSYSHYFRDSWDGPGDDERNHIDAKAVYDFDADNSISVSVLYNEAVNNFHRQLTKAQFDRGYTTGFNESLTPAYFNTTGTITQSGSTNQFNAANNGEYYQYRINPFQNLILSAPSNFKLTENVRFDTTPYFWYGYGSGGGVQTISEANGVQWGNLTVRGNLNPGVNANTSDTLLFYNPSITRTDRPGVINKFTVDAGAHKVVFGNWFEYAMHRQTKPFVPLTSDGSIQDPYAQDESTYLTASSFSGATCRLGTVVVACPGGPIQGLSSGSPRDWTTNSMTNMLFLGDTWTMNDKLSADFGVKQMFLNRNVKVQTPGGEEANLYDSATLPQAGVSYKIDDNQKVFGNFATSFRSAPNFTLTPLGVSAGGVLANPTTKIDPEHGISFEVGYRYQGSLFSTSVSAFYGQYENYQQSTRILDSNGNAQTATIGIGGLSNYGINAEIGTRQINGFRPYASVELLQTRLADDLPALTTANIATLLPTSGKQLPGASNYNIGLGLDYDNGQVIGNLGYKYTGPAYSTFMNDEQNPGFGRLDAMIGYRFKDIGYLKQPELRLNLSNLAGGNQLVGVNSIANNVDAVTTAAGTVSGCNPGAANPPSTTGCPNYYVGEGFSAMVTLSSGF
jgi:iron complex outermembrane recepter protein